jgi:MFS transporter, DHA1 family, multidrug resistance protein
MPATDASSHNSLKLIVPLAAVSLVGPFSTDTYLPSILDIGQAFHVSAVITQQTLTAYIVPFAVMTLFHGGLSDALGRRRVILWSLVIFVLASLGCALSWDISSLMCFRVLQGMTAGAGMVVGRAMVRDLFDGTEAQKFMSQMALVFAMGPALGPVIGGWLDSLWGWRSVFYFLAGCAALLVFLTRAQLPETLPPEKRVAFHPGPILRNYREIFSSKAFVLLSVALTLGFCSAFIYIISAPMFLTGLLHIPNTSYLMMFGPMTLCMIAGALLSGYLAGRWKRWQILTLAATIMIGTAGFNLVYHFFNAPSLPWSLLPLPLFFLGSSLAMPILTLLALDLFPGKRGTASSCQSFAQSIGNAVATAVIAPLLWGSALHLAWGMALLLSMAVAAFLLHMKMRSDTPFVHS